MVTNSFTPTSDDLRAVRSKPQRYRLGEEHLFIRLVVNAGYYDIDVWPELGTGEARFTLVQGERLLPPIRYPQFALGTPEQAIAWANQLEANAPWTLEHKLQPSPNLGQLYCQPVLDRDRLITDQKYDQQGAVRRRRADKVYRIYLQFHCGPCEHWHVHHAHAAQVQVLAKGGQEVSTEVFDCDHVWDGVKRYEQILANFDSFAMELEL